MWHVPLAQPKKEINYKTIVKPASPKPIVVDTEDGSLPQAPDGFTFHRVKQGETLVSLAVKYNVSQSKLQRFNKKLCFGHRLAHLNGKLLLIPLSSSSTLNKNTQKQVLNTFDKDNEITKEGKKNENNDINDEKYVEPDENAKYHLRKALKYYAKDLDNNRCDYYLKESNWNVRNALNKWQNDDKWEKEMLIKNKLGLSDMDYIRQILEINGYNIMFTLEYYKKEQKKLKKMKKKVEKNKKINKYKTQETEGYNNTTTQTLINKKKNTFEMTGIING